MGQPNVLVLGGKAAASTRGVVRGGRIGLSLVSFDGVADEYEAGRPGYPPEIYDALGPLAGQLTLEIGAGTGIATRQLLDRGATVIPLDIGPVMLRKAKQSTPRLPAVVADGTNLPLRTGCADLVCFAQSWHWLDERSRAAEMARVLRPDGRWAGWWTHARADGEAWFDSYWSTIEEAIPGTNRGRRDLDWGEGLRRSGLFTVSDRVTVPWIREVSVDVWLMDQLSHSYIAALPALRRDALIARLQRVVRDEFGNGPMTVRHETWLWIGLRLHHDPAAAL
jgi:SAM-dependent methyltransferase